MPSSLTPAQFDAKELEVYKEMWEMESHLPAVWNLVHQVIGDTQVSNGYGRGKRWAMTNEDAMDQLVVYATALTIVEPRLRMSPAEVLQRFEAVEHGIETRRLMISAMEAEYARNPWTRWFKCTNADGHVHSSLRGCPTVHFDTGMAWITSMSGQDEDAAVADPRLGPTLCSVCFPEAPVERRQSQRDVDRAAREAEKAARQEAKYVKQLRPESYRGAGDGEVFRTSDRELITTVAACKALVRKAAETSVELEWLESGDALKAYGKQNGWMDADQAAEALAHRTANAASRLKGELADAAEANRVLFAREAAAPGTGWTQGDADKAILSATKRTRKAYFG